MSLAASLGGEVSIGLNDVVIEKMNSQHMVNVDIAVDGDSFLTYRCDGVIIASPTGSSAYTLSAGGPLIDTQLEAMVITPVAPYSLFRAAVVIGPESEVVCEVVQSQPAGVSVDGLRIGVLSPGEKVLITRGPDVQMVDFSFRSYAETLKQKLRLHEGLEGVLNWETDA
jgi:NAD+ kinase